MKCRRVVGKHHHHVDLRPPTYGPVWRQIDGVKAVMFRAITDDVPHTSVIQPSMPPRLRSEFPEGSSKMASVAEQRQRSPGIWHDAGACGRSSASGWVT